MADRNAPTVAPTRPGILTFPPPSQFSSLSIKDLLDARDAYHVQLSHLDSVVGTAIGRYLIDERHWYASHPPAEPPPPDHVDVRRPRTFKNAVVRAWSWPCLLVMVDRWSTRGSPGHQPIPKRLYMPDGRVIPTCVVLAPPDEEPRPPARALTYASDLLGGGYSCVRDAQCVPQLGTVGCLVEREGTYYALTNRHVAGPDGGVVHAVVRGERKRIGISDRQAANRVRMTEIFPGWPGDHTFINIDAGLVRLDDIRDWTSQVFGIGEIGEPFDATPHALTLDIIGAPLRAFGGCSGVLEGEIKALFVRYKSLGGYDYVSDLLIGCRHRGGDGDARQPYAPSVESHAGDSGTLWFYDPDEPPPAAVDPDGPPVPERGARARRLRPIAMQWGGQRLRWDDEDGAAHTSSFALATFVSTVCRVLDVDLVRGYGTGHDEYWGKIAHFSAGWKACDVIAQLGSPALARLMKANQRNIGFDDETLRQGKEFRVGRGNFTPIADWPDYKFLRRPNEGIQHFADIDVRDIEGGPTMLARCAEDPRQISAAAWQAYFAGFAARGVGPDPGTLPFRVWQLWDAMVDALRGKDVLAFVATAGTLAHYVADASQPLHCSYLHHGRLPMMKVDGRRYPVRHDSQDYAAYHDKREAKIHAVIDELVFEVEPDVALARVTEALADAPDLIASLGLPPAITCGWEAATAAIRLMAEAQRRLPPKVLLDADDPELGPTARAKQIWADARIGAELPQLVALATATLAVLWQSAWIAGGGDDLPASALTACTEPDLEALCNRRDFLAALSLDDMVAAGTFEPPRPGDRVVTPDQRRGEAEWMFCGI